MSTSARSSSNVNFMPVSFRNARRHFLAMADTCAVIPPPSLCRGHLHTRPSTRPSKPPSPPQGLLPGSIACRNDAGLIPLRSGCVRKGFRFAHSPPRPSMLARKAEEHTSELPSLMRISYAVFCLQKKKLYYYYTTFDRYMRSINLSLNSQHATRSSHYFLTSSNLHINDH